VVLFLASLILSMLVGIGPSLSQSNLDAGKSAEQIFSDTCSACHHAPQDLKAASAQFLRQHYTTGARQAAAMAAYLEKAINEPRPTPAAPPQPFRRPSESVEMGAFANGSAGSAGEASRTAASKEQAANMFEE
jgi:cytochrome c551/c552